MANRYQPRGIDLVVDTECGVLMSVTVAADTLNKAKMEIEILRTKLLYTENRIDELVERRRSALKEKADA